MTQTAVAVIDTAALQHNFRVLKQAAPGCRIVPAVKADAYGHGLVEVARHLPEADAFAVARVAEGVTLRLAGIKQRVIVLGGCLDTDEVGLAVQHQLDIVLHHAVQFELLDAFDGHGRLDAWIKLDTGMGRLGFDPAEFPQVVQRVSAHPMLNDELRVMTHLACADETGNDMTHRQVERFAHCVSGGDVFAGDVSIANSAAMLAWPETISPSAELKYSGENWARPGLALYGVSPVEGRTAAELDLQPVMSFRSRLLSVKPLKAGSPVGYGADWVAERDTLLGIAAVGYGDGYPRHVAEGTPVLVDGVRVPLAGRVSMDMIAIDLGQVPDAKPGDPVELWGSHLEVQEIAHCAGTNAYELLTQISPRTARKVI